MLANLPIEYLYSNIIVASSFDNDSGKTRTWKISDDVYDRMLETDWTSAPDISITKYVKKAHSLVSNNNPGKFVVIDRISIVQPINAEIRKNKYFYDISFEVYSADKKDYLRTEQVVMFLDGTIIDPEEN